MEKWQVIETLDQSPSLTWKLTGEAMHHSGGALAETESIYGPALEMGFQLHSCPLITCVGLGLGYIEFLAARKALERAQAIELLSFESEPELRETMIEFILGQENELLNRVLNLVAGSKIRACEIKTFLKSLYQCKKWKIQQALLSAKQISECSQVLCWDAFSVQTSEALWGEAFLTEVFQRTQVDSVVVSYASNGVLKRALAKAGFYNFNKEGFFKKRESTLALKKS